MFIQAYTGISAQGIHGPHSWTTIQDAQDGKLMAQDPSLEGIPAGLLRRMSKAVRLGIGAGLPLLQQYPVDGIILGTANGGMEDCIKFLNQIIDYDEGMLTPGNFVQSTPNAIAGQLSMFTKNRNYNATHVHLGLAFENALIDAQLFLKEFPTHHYLVGGVDEISTYNYNIDQLAGWYDENLKASELFTHRHKATVAGEGAAMFLLNNQSEGALARIVALETLHTTDPQMVEARFSRFVQTQIPNQDTLLWISGENGDHRFDPFFLGCERSLAGVPTARFKSFTGEYPTAVSLAIWLACQAFEFQNLPESFFKGVPMEGAIDRIIIYNQYQGQQHSFMVLEHPNALR